MREQDGVELDDVVAVTGELIATKRVGAFVAHTFVAPGVAERARPGQLVSLSAGDEWPGISNPLTDALTTRSMKLADDIGAAHR